VVNRNRSNGSRYEREFVAQCQAAGLVAQRVPLSGAMKGYPGDVIVSDEITIECKYRKGGAGFKRLFERVIDSDIMAGFFCVESSGLRAMTFDTWAKLELDRVNNTEFCDITANVDRPGWSTRFEFLHAAFDQGECAADFVACRVQTPNGQRKLPWMMVQRINVCQACKGGGEVPVENTHQYTVGLLGTCKTCEGAGHD